MPSLKERPEDIPKLIQHFINKFENQYGGQSAKLSAPSKKLLLDHDWPGNVRELSNKLERFVLLGDEQELIDELSNQELSKQDLTSASATNTGENTGEVQHSGEFIIPDNGMNWDDFEKQALQQALLKTKNNKTKAAKLLGMGYKQFLYRIEKFEL
jgi:DNA-binding NtrC family response regulator